MNEIIQLRKERQAMFTPEIKLHAFANRFYSFQIWEPKSGDFYTVTRADTQLFQIDKIEDGKVHIVNCELGPEAAQDGTFEQSGFTSEGFGVCRVHVPEWIFRIAENGS